jgi:hypothetical protein
MGRAYRERRHYSHITIRVSSEKREEDRPRVRRERAAKPAPAPDRPAVEGPAE